MPDQTAKTTGNSGRQGSALIAVLVVLGVTSTLLLLSQSLAVSRSTLTYTQARSLEQFSALQELVRMSMQRLADDEDLLADHLDEPWAETIELVSPTGTRLSAEIIDANRFIDLNNAPVEDPNLLVRPPREMFIDMINVCRLPDDPPPSPRVDALIDYLDANNEGLFEDPEEGFVLNGPITVWDDLSLITGWNPAIYDRVRIEDPDAPPHPRDTFTILPSDDEPRREIIRVNINTAPEHVLRGLAGQGVKQQVMVEQILTFRKEEPVRDLNSYFSRLPPAQMQAASAWLDTKSSYFVIHASSESKGGDLLERTVLVHRNSEGKVRVLQWQP